MRGRDKLHVQLPVRCSAVSGSSSSFPGCTACPAAPQRSQGVAQPAGRHALDAGAQEGKEGSQGVVEAIATERQPPALVPHVNALYVGIQEAGLIVKQM
jgi:hypothetical protein